MDADRREDPARAIRVDEPFLARRARRSRLAASRPARSPGSTALRNRLRFRRPPGPHRDEPRRRANGRDEAPIGRPISIDDLFARLGELGPRPRIYGKPNEMEVTVSFAEDREHAAYDADAVSRFFRALSHADRLLRRFRARFIGKCSPVHFFWGSFDLAVTRFSGRPAPRHEAGPPNCPPKVTEEAYSHEVSSAGFWPGGRQMPRPVFYSYAYPEPEGFRADSRAPGRGVVRGGDGGISASLRRGSRGAVLRRSRPRLPPEHLRSGREQREMGSRGSGKGLFVDVASAVFPIAVK